MIRALAKRQEGEWHMGSISSYQHTGHNTVSLIKGEAMFQRAI